MRSRALAVALVVACSWIAPRTAAAMRVTFVVTAPATTPADATLHVSGNRAELGAWSGTGPALERRTNGDYAATVELANAGPLEFKITRGSWDTVEKGAGGEEVANRTWSAHDGDTVRVAVVKWRDQVEGPAAHKHSTRTGDVRVHASFASKYVKPRDVLVWLPPGYNADTTRRYPVLYCHDGNNMFDDSTSFAGEWQLDETAARLIASGRIAPFICVAVYNTPDRMAEYTPAADARHGGGRSGDYARFLVEELKPFVDRAYRTQTAAAATGLVGSSLGGLVSLAIAFDHPDVFGLVGAVSPSAWWADRWIVKRAASARPGLRIWIDIGTAEGGSADEASSTVADAHAVADALRKRGYRDGTSLRYLEVPGAHHNEAAWSARLDQVLEFLLPRGN